MVAVFHKLSDGDETKPVEVARAFLRMYLALQAFRAEIIDNRALLVCETLRRPAYRKKEELNLSLKPTDGKPASAA
jgi:hypothetical protein